MGSLNSSHPSDRVPAALRLGFSLVLILALLTIWLEAAWVVLLLEATLFALGGCLVCFPGGAGARATPAGWGLAAVAAVGGVQLATGSTISASDTLQGVLFWLSLAAAAALAGSLWPSRKESENFLRAAAAGAAGLSLLATLQWFTSSGRYFWIWPSADPNVFGPFQSRNNFASFVLLFLPFVAGQWLGASDWRRWPWLLGAGAMTGGVIASGSRAGAGLVVAELMILLILHLRGRGKRRDAVALVSVAAIALALLGWEALARKLQDTDPLRYRRDMMHSAALMTSASPLAGLGLETFPTAYPAFAKFDSGHFVNHAHNDWLEIASEAGMIGWAGFPLAVLVFLYRYVRLPGGLGIAAVCLHALVDYPFQRLGLAVWIVAIAAATATSALPAKSR